MVKMVKLQLNALIACICLAVLVSETEGATTKAAAPVVTNAPVTTKAPVVTNAPVTTKAPVVTPAPGGTPVPGGTPAPNGNKSGGNGANGMTTGSLYKWIGMFITTMFMLSNL